MEIVLGPGYLIWNQLDPSKKWACKIEEEKKMANKFEVGDKVHFCYLDAHNELFQPELTDVFDQEGIIVAIDGDYSLAVKFEKRTFELNVDWIELVEKAKKPWNGKVVCVDSHSNFFTKGKIYEVKTGYLYDDSKTPYFAGNRYYDCPNHTLTYSAEFIEFKGFANE